MVTIDELMISIFVSSLSAFIKLLPSIHFKMSLNLGLTGYQDCCKLHPSEGIFVPSVVVSSSQLSQSCSCENGSAFALLRGFHHWPQSSSSSGDDQQVARRRTLTVTISYRLSLARAGIQYSEVFR